MNVIDILAKVRERLLDGKGRCTNSANKCVYRRSDGNKCAVGYIMPDEDYREYMDRTDSAIGAVIAKFDHLPAWMQHNASLLSELQYVHDRESTWIAGDLSDCGKRQFNILVRRYAPNNPELLMEVN